MSEVQTKKNALAVQDAIMELLQEHREEVRSGAPVRGDFENSAALALKSLGAYLRAIDGERARGTMADPLCMPVGLCHRFMTTPIGELHYTLREGDTIERLRAKILVDSAEIYAVREGLLNKFGKNYAVSEFDRFISAVDFATIAHAGQFRDSGEPYIVHPMTVCSMIMDMGMDPDSVIAGLLHDSVEDNADITSAEVAEKFGAGVASLVDGVTKLTKVSLEKTTREQQQAENVRKMFLAMAKDMRVIPIKLADRMHNMRTLEYCHSEKRVRKAKETLEIYAPLAHRLGMGQLKSELEDLAFMHIEPEEYDLLKDQFEHMKGERQAYLEDCMTAIKHKLEENNINGSVNGRPKHLYSIYRKMKAQNCTFQEVYDLIAIRVVVDTLEECYSVLGMVHSMWKPLPGRIKDYISTPKPNGYRSLHTTLVGVNGVPFEVQIRTLEMHKQAEFGIAAHWRYKEGRADSSDLDVVMDWVRQIMEERIEDSDEFMQMLKFDFFSDYVFVFTPEGEIVDLPTGSIPIDFAYRIHSQVGHSCIGARVNGRIVTLDYKLRMGDIVEIITSSNVAGPSRDWLNIVKTQQAKSKIRSWFKKERKEDNIERGRDMLTAEAKRQGYNIVQLAKVEWITTMFKRLSITTLDDLYAAVGYGSLTVNQVITRLVDEFKRQQEAEQAKDPNALLEKLNSKQPAKKRKDNNGIVVEGYSDMVVRIAKCCTPVPGDEIVGYITRGRGVSVHRADCKNLINIEGGDARSIKVEWAEHVPMGSGFAAQVRIVASERVGLLMDISQLFMSMNMSIAGFTAKTDKNLTATINVEFDVHDAEQLRFVIKQLKHVRGVTEVYRVRG